MPFEEGGELASVDVFDLIRKEAAGDRVILVSITNAPPGTDALVVVATGERASALRRLMETVSA